MWNSLRITDVNLRSPKLQRERRSKRAYIQLHSYMLSFLLLLFSLPACIRFHACLIAGFNFGFETHDHVFAAEAANGGAIAAANSDDSRVSRGHTYNSLAAAPDQIMLQPIHIKIPIFYPSFQNQFDNIYNSNYRLRNSKYGTCMFSGRGGAESGRRRCQAPHDVCCCCYVCV